MENALSLADLMVFLNPFLLGIVGFFLKNIHSKISEIDKNTATLLTHSAVHQRRMDDFERRLNVLEELFRNKK